MKSHVISFAVLAMAFTLLCSCSSSSQEAPEANMHAKGKIVYAAKEIQEGSEITIDALEEREVEKSKILLGYIDSASLAVGRVSKFGIMQGSVVSQQDLSQQGPTSNIHVTLDDEAIEKLEKMAESKGKSPSELASKWVMESLKTASK